MNNTARWTAALLAASVVLAALPPAKAETVNKDDVKKIAVVGAAASAVDKIKPKAKTSAAPNPANVDIPDMLAGQPAGKKAAKQKAAAIRQAADESFQQVAAMAKAGDIQAQYILGVACYTGRQAEEDEKTAVELWRQAAFGGHPDAAAYLGLAYAKGFGDMPKNDAEARRRYLRSAQNGSVLANVLLGIEDYKNNMPADKQAAIERFRTAAQQGNSQAKAFLQIIERKGTDASADFGASLDWKKEAGKTPLSDLYTQAGTNAFWGRIVKQDHAAAVAWWELAAKEDNAAAQALLGTAYYTGRGAALDEKTAVALFKTAADKNEPLAQYMLGKAYLAGNVVQKNKELALKLFRAAGEAGIADARRQADELGRE